jgi:hypothetical protein
MSASALVPELAVYCASFGVYHSCDIFPGFNLSFGPYTWDIAAAHGVFCNDGRFAHDKSAWNTCSLLVIFYPSLAEMLSKVHALFFVCALFTFA